MLLRSPSFWSKCFTYRAGAKHGFDGPSIGFVVSIAKYSHTRRYIHTHSVFCANNNRHRPRSRKIYTTSRRWHHWATEIYFILGLCCRNSQQKSLPTLLTLSAVPHCVWSAKTILYCSMSFSTGPTKTAPFWRLSTGSTMPANAFKTSASIRPGRCYWYYVSWWLFG